MPCVTNTIVFGERSHRRISSFAKPDARLLVERAERLVHEQHRRVGHERARDRGALLHPARQLVRPSARVVGQADQSQHVARRAAARPRAARRASRTRPRRCRARASTGRATLPETRSRWAARRPRTARAADRDTAFGGDVQAGQDAQQRALAAAARTHDRDELAVGDLQVHVVERDRSGGIPFRQVLDCDRGHAAPCSQSRPPDLRGQRAASERTKPRCARIGASTTLATLMGLEPTTSAVTGRRSNQLSYNAIRRDGGHGWD